MERETENKLRSYEAYLGNTMEELRNTIDSGKFRHSTKRIA